MPSKHVDEQTWRKVEKETVRAVIAAQASIKETEVLRMLILKGLKHITEDDYRDFAEKKRS
ncbi:hypothetical protein [Shewanella glacialipiscicola]|uniref:hypothetical protein n=1 Tax=Shewanella glacialipiscicola TaxID=614069 RepID=UPI003D79AFB4